MFSVAKLTWMQHCSGREHAARLLGEKLVPQDPVKRDAGAVRRLEPSPRKASRNTRTASWMANQHAWLNLIMYFKVLFVGSPHRGRLSAGVAWAFRVTLESASCFEPSMPHERDKWHRMHVVVSTNMMLQRILQRQKSCSKISFRAALIYYYIFSGADTPIKRNALAIVVWTAVINARRASVSSLLSTLITFSAP